MEDQALIEAIVVNRLLKWARWKLQTGVALGYPSRVSFLRLTPPAFDERDPRLDADCLMTDRAVNLLPEVYKLVIRLEYIDAIPSLMQKAHCYGKSQRTFLLDRKTAYEMIGRLIDECLNREEVVDNNRLISLR